MCDYVIFSLIMRSDAARGQLWEITPAHNIRSRDYSARTYNFTDASRTNHMSDQPPMHQNGVTTK